MNKVFDNGYNIVTSYRNSKNFTQSWISSGYSLWFLKEARYLNNPRMTLGNSCAISGTGFLVSTKTIEETNGWKFFTLTEDIEFTFNRVKAGDKIGYAENAIIYDEQPTTFSVSIKQRSRWAKGCLQVINLYSIGLVKKIVKERDFSSFDMIMNNVPTMVLGVVGLVSNISIMLYEFTTKPHAVHVIMTLASILFNVYISMVALGMLTAITERKRIRASNWQLIKAVLTFPLFVSTYVVAFLVAVFTNVTWKPIPHNATVSAKEMKNQSK